MRKPIGELKPRAGESRDHRRNRAASSRYRRGSRHRAIPIAVSMAPMIDLTFLLLIFFLVTTTFERAEGILASRVPEVEGPGAVELPLTPIIVRIDQVGPGHEDFALSFEKFSARPANFDELTEALRRIQELPGFDVETPVVILAGRDVRWDHVVSCWNAALRAGSRKVAFGEQG